MGLLNLTPPTIGQPNATEDVDTVNAFSTIQTWANGNIDESNLTNALVQRLGINGGGNVGQGGSFIGTSGTRTNVAFGALSDGPDQVANIVLPTNGWIAVMFQAAWSTTVTGAGQAAIFLGANGAKIAQGNVAAPVVQAAQNDGGAGIVTPLATGPGGLMANALAAGVVTSYTGDVTTGQIVGNATYEAASANGGTGANAPHAPMGGPCYIFAAAGTYTVSVQFLATSGTVTVANRKLWVWTRAF